MAITLYLLRHGETEGSEIPRYKGSKDIPLSEKGIGQMERAAAYISQRVSRVAALYCSPLSRAQKSAEIIAHTYGVEPVAVNELTERRFGLWEGMSYDEIKEQYPEAFKAWADNPFQYSPPEGESTSRAGDRVIKALDNILGRHRSRGMPADGHDTLIIVAHGGINRIMLCHFMNMPLEHIFRIEQDYGAVNIVEFRDRYPVIKLLNYTP
jgi:alpha-ribazole phosphatase